MGESRSNRSFLGLNDLTARITIKDKVEHKWEPILRKDNSALPIERVIIMSNTSSPLCILTNKSVKTEGKTTWDPEFFSSFLTTIISLQDEQFKTYENYLIRPFKIQTAQPILVLKYKELIICTYLINLDEKLEEIAKLFSLQILSQFIQCFEEKDITKFIEIDQLFKEREITTVTARSYYEDDSQIINPYSVERNIWLLKFSAFGEMDLNYIWDQFLNSYKLAFHKEKKDITKFKLMKVTVQQVTDETDILFDQNFGYNKFTFLEFKNNKEFRKIIKHEVDILKKKTASSKKSLNWPLNTENEVTLVVGNFIVNIVYIPPIVFQNAGISITTFFKIRRSYNRFLSKSDLFCMLVSEQYVRVSRDDENLTTFPFKDIDNDVISASNFIHKQFNLQNEALYGIYTSETFQKRIANRVEKYKEKAKRGMEKQNIKHMSTYRMNNKEKQQLIFATNKRKNKNLMKYDKPGKTRNLDQIELTPTLGGKVPIVEKPPKQKKLLKVQTEGNLRGLSKIFSNLNLEQDRSPSTKKGLGKDGKERRTPYMQDEDGDSGIAPDQLGKSLEFYTEKTKSKYGRPMGKGRGSADYTNHKHKTDNLKMVQYTSVPKLIQSSLAMQTSGGKTQGQGRPHIRITRGEGVRPTSTIFTPKFDSVGFKFEPPEEPKHPVVKRGREVTLNSGAVSGTKNSIVMTEVSPTEKLPRMEGEGKVRNMKYKTDNKNKESKENKESRKDIYISYEGSQIYSDESSEGGTKHPREMQISPMHKKKESLVSFMEHNSASASANPNPDPNIIPHNKHRNASQTRSEGHSQSGEFMKLEKIEPGTIYQHKVRGGQRNNLNGKWKTMQGGSKGSRQTRGDMGRVINPMHTMNLTSFLENYDPFDRKEVDGEVIGVLGHRGGGVVSRGPTPFSQNSKASPYPNRRLDLDISPIPFCDNESVAIEGNPTPTLYFS